MRNWLSRRRGRGTTWAPQPPRLASVAPESRMRFSLRLAVFCALLETCVALSPFYEKAPCPRRQLLSYVAHVGGGGATGMRVYARSKEDESCAWLTVGSVAAGSPDTADDSVDTVTCAVQFQQRLIVEHACRLDRSLIPAKRNGQIELAVEPQGGGSRSIVPMVHEAGSASWEQMLACGFAGVAAGRGIYQDFESGDGARAYDRVAVRDELRNAIASSKIVLFAWPRCGYATTARSLLGTELYADVVVDKFSPQHAELALLTGRPTVPCIFVDGELVGGCHEDERHPGLVKTLETRRDGDSPPPSGKGQNGGRVSSLRMSAEPEPLCDGCHERCAGCAWEWIDDDFLEAGGSLEALQLRDAAARAALGMQPLDPPQEQQPPPPEEQQEAPHAMGGAAASFANTAATTSRRGSPVVMRMSADDSGGGGGGPVEPTPDAEALKALAAENAEVLPQAYFESIKYDEGGVPWDLYGRPQPPVRNAANAGEFGAAGTCILDCGCGAGDNANWLATRGYDVLGFDFCPSAVQTARERAASAEVASAIAETDGGAVEIVRASATDLDAASRIQERAKELGGFETVLDSALLHCLDDEAQHAYVSGLRPLVRTGGKVLVGCFSDANPDPWSNPRRMSEAQLRALFSEERGFRITELREAWYERPSDRASGRGGAWTMAWWCVAEAVEVQECDL